MFLCALLANHIDFLKPVSSRWASKKFPGQTDFRLQFFFSSCYTMSVPTPLRTSPRVTKVLFMTPLRGYRNQVCCQNYFEIYLRRTYTVSKGVKSTFLRDFGPTSCAVHGAKRTFCCFCCLFKQFEESFKKSKNCNKQLPSSFSHTCLPLFPAPALTGRVAWCKCLAQGGVIVCAVNQRPKT